MTDTWVLLHCSIPFLIIRVVTIITRQIRVHLEGWQTIPASSCLFLYLFFILVSLSSLFLSLTALSDTHAAAQPGNRFHSEQVVEILGPPAYMKFSYTTSDTFLASGQFLVIRECSLFIRVLGCVLKGCIAVTPLVEQSKTGSEPQNIRRGALLSFWVLSSSMFCRMKTKQKDGTFRIEMRI